LVRGPAWIRKLQTLSLLYIAVFLTRIGFGTIIVVFPVYVLAGSALTGIITALYPAVEGLSALPVGAYVDRKGRRRAFVLGMVLISIFTFAIGLTPNLLSVSGAHALSGLAAALVTVSSLTMITDLTVEKNRGAGMGAFDLANLGGYGVGIAIGAAFLTIFKTNLGYSFLVVAGILGAATGFVYFSLKEPPHSVQQRKSLREMYDNLTGEVAAIFPIWFSLTVVVGFYLFLPKIAKNINPAADFSQSAWLILLGLAVLGGGALLFGRISDKIGRTRTMAIGAVGEIGFLLLLPDLFPKLIAIAPGTSWVESYNQIGPIIIVGGLFFFLGAAIIPSILAYIGDKAAQDFRGSAMGLYSLMLSAGIALGTVLAGITDELAGVQGVFYSAVIIFSGLSLTSAFLLHREKRLASTGDVEKTQNKPI